MPRAPRRLLEDLVARGNKAAITGKERAVVTVQLITGRDLVGRVVAMRDDGGIAVLALHVAGPIDAPQVAHIRVDQIVAVTHEVVADRPAYADEPAPGRLELSRALADRAAVVAARLGGPLALVTHDPLGDDERRAVMAAIPMIAGVLGKLADDAIGKDALRALGEVRVGATSRGGVRRDATTLTIEVPIAADDAWDEPTLRAAVEKAL